MGGHWGLIQQESKGVLVVAQSGREASQTRDYCVAKNATLRAARPDSLGKLGTGSSLRKEPLFRMTIVRVNLGSLCARDYLNFSMKNTGSCVLALCRLI